MQHPGRILIDALAQAAHSAAMSDSEHGCQHPQPGAQTSYIPNVTVQTHKGETARFYDDLVRGKMVLINCISIRDEASCSHLETVSQVQPLIEKELGRSVFIYSITTDPIHDTPAALRAFAEQCKARDGWLFVTGDPRELLTLRLRLFMRSGQDCSMHMIRYGNEALGLWGGILATATPESIAERVAWITPGETPVGPPTRGGPPILESEG